MPRRSRSQSSRRRHAEPSSPSLPNDSGRAYPDAETNPFDPALALQSFLRRCPPTRMPYCDGAPNVERFLIGAVAEKFQSPRLAIEGEVADLRAVLLMEGDGPSEKFYVDLYIANFLQFLVQIVEIATRGGDAVMDDLRSAIERLRQSRLLCHHLLRQSRAAIAVQITWRDDLLSALGSLPTN